MLRVAMRVDRCSLREYFIEVKRRGRTRTPEIESETSRLLSGGYKNFLKHGLYSVLHTYLWNERREYGDWFSFKTGHIAI